MASGHLVLRSPQAWTRDLLRYKGREVFVSLAGVARRARHTQHGYYRSTVLPLLAEEWGWADQAELHFRLKEKHIPPELWVSRYLGREVPTKEPPSSADLTVEQFAAFVQAVIDHATEEGIRVPPPREKESA
jgi:hypothetical protein